ncbi:hypothetical protein [uncultured Microbacterium sp.]|uniref:hypothetical protein n=1 Tax=uncultured Microbacterium sp. TaxID=191216 RepID=UPI0035CA2DCE
MSDPLSKARLVYAHGPGAFRSLAEVRMTAARDGRYVPIRQRAFADATDWAQLSDEGRLRTRIEVVASAARRHEPVFSHTAAGALHGLPLYRVSTGVVHVITRGENPPKSQFDVVRHRDALTDADVVRVGGHVATSLERTVYDIIRAESLETAVAVFDAALRSVAWNDDVLTYDFAAAARFRRAVAMRVDAARGARGRLQAQFVTAFADGRAQLPAESVSRLWLYELGVPAPELQYRVVGVSGRTYFLDMAWPELGIFGEFDGQGKYTLPHLTKGRTEVEVRAAEAEREAEIRAATGWRPIRWKGVQISALDSFAEFLRDAGILDHPEA